MLAVSAAHADFGHAGGMVSPCFLELVPQSSLIRRCTVYSGNYTFTGAPLHSRPEERKVQTACGPGLTDPEMESASVRLKLPDVSIFEMEWKNGWSPDRITVSAWDLALFENPERMDELFLESFTVENNRVILKPDRVYQITGEWILDKSGTAPSLTGFAAFLMITLLGLDNTSPYEGIDSFGPGIAFGMIVSDVVFTSRYAAKIRALKHRLLRKAKGGN